MCSYVHVHTHVGPRFLQRTCQDCSHASTLLPVALLLLSNSLRLSSVLRNSPTECGTVRKGTYVSTYVVCVCAHRWLCEYIQSGTCLVLICMNTKISVSDIIALHYSMSILPSLPFPPFTVFYFPCPSAPQPSQSHPSTPPHPLYPSPPPLPFKARPSHWMACRHVLLCTVQGGECHSQ